MKRDRFKQSNAARALVVLLIFLIMATVLAPLGYAKGKDAAQTVLRVAQEQHPLAVQVSVTQGNNKAKAVLRIVVDPSALSAQPSVTTGDNGTVTFEYRDDANPYYGILIQYGGENAFYAFIANGQPQSFPLQLGPGTYTVMLLARTGEYDYQAVYKQDVQVQGSSDFLSSAYNVDWQDAPLAVAKAKGLTASAQDDRSRLYAIYNYLVKTMQYDYAKTDITERYIPNLDETLTTAKGVCYDTAALFAGMCRSVGIPAKLCTGTSQYVSGNHAWCEVLVEGQWITVDVTLDAERYRQGRHYQLRSDPGKYEVRHYY